MTATIISRDPAKNSVNLDNKEVPGRICRNLFMVSAVSLERMLLVSASKMNRKGLALVIVLFLAGLAPAAAIIGFCTRMPCCNHASGSPLELTTETHDCCTTVSCYESPSVKLASGAAVSDALIAAQVFIHIVVAPSPQRISALDGDASPPIGTRHR